MAINQEKMICMIIALIAIIAFVLSVVALNKAMNKSESYAAMCPTNQRPCVDNPSKCCI
jgi:hypothetical protein